MTALTPYLELTKPRLLPLVLLSGLPALVMAAGGWPRIEVLAVILVGTALAAGAANALNCYLERERDRDMLRTRTRPLPDGRLSPRAALVFALALLLAGPGLLATAPHPLAAAVAVAGILFYVFVYTIWLKPRSSAAVIVGGVAGAVAPLIADAGITGTIGAAGLIPFAIIFVWQPPHFWAITLYRRSEYEQAGFPLLLSRIGVERTRLQIAIWIACLLPLTLLPVALDMLGVLYAGAALGLGAWFLYHGVRLMREKSDEAARRVFRVSLIYLMTLFVAMIADLALRGGTA